MTTLTINNAPCKIPSGWNEMTREHMLFLADLMATPLPEHDFKMKMLLAFTGWKLLPAKSDEPGALVVFNKEVYRLEPWQFTAICDKLNFLFDETEHENGKVIRVNSKCTTNHFPHIRSGLWFRWVRRLYGPSDRLYNLTFGEYIAADNFFRRYVATGKVEFLDKLIATLWRNEDRNYQPNEFTYRGDRREPFNEYTVNTRMNKVRGLPMNMKVAILLWWNGCINHLAEQFPHVFNGGGTKSKFGSLALVDALTSGDVTKSKQVRRQFLWDVMVHLEQTMISHNEQMEKMKRNGK